MGEGSKYRPLVWSCWGRGHPDATAILQAALDSPALKTLRIDPPARASAWVTQPLFVRRPGVAVLVYDDSEERHVAAFGISEVCDAADAIRRVPRARS